MIVFKQNNKNSRKIPLFNYFERPERLDPYFLKKFPQIKDKNGCLKRSIAHEELKKVLKPHINNFENPHKFILLIGSFNALGLELQNVFTKKKENYLSIGSINDLDFSSSDALDLFNNYSIKEAYLTYSPPLIRHTSSDGSGYIKNVTLNYFNGLLNFLKHNSIRWIFASSLPIFKEHVDLLLKHRGSVVELPFLVDSSAYDDLENPTMRAVRECQKVQYSHIEFSESSSYQSVTPEDVAKFLLRQIKGNKPKHFIIQGFSKTSVPSAIYAALNSLNLHKCSVYFSNYSHSLDLERTSYIEKIIGSKTDVIQMISDVYKTFSYQERAKPYLSIVVTGRNDNYSSTFQTRAQNFLNALNYSSFLCPLANFEVVFVDYGTSENQKLLAQILDIGNSIKGKVRYIIVNPKIHQEICKIFKKCSPFYEFVAKNIGIKRSNGEMVLTTNADNLFSTELMEIVASHQLNPYIVYTGTRWNTDNSLLATEGITIQKLITLVSEVWTLKSIPIQQSCKIPINRYVIIDSCSQLFKYLWFCAPGDFFLLSKNYWDFIKGFDEVPANPAVDVVFHGRLMKFFPGYIRMNLYPIFIHQSHRKQNAFRRAFPHWVSALKQYCCDGFHFNDRTRFQSLRYTWGSNHVNLPEILY